ncbi:hypothetical protein PoB_006282400 [Plakobranchus ocellatus]|uniref:Ig-like domain-containing protein n=1 Tax=Plakobranchus ocellatus TaxID=259542 RepID=A0AAV4CWM8_9GAST|nr:hypothetical protein PoB_006282400 [Plakobranchus ocellatus]
MSGYSGTLLLTILAAMLAAVPACIVGLYECSSYNGRTSCLQQSQICDSTKDCHWNDDEKGCEDIPDISMYCAGASPKDGYYKGRSITCHCYISTSGKHKGEALWLQNDVPVSEPRDKITLRSNESDKNEGYECKGKSGYGKYNAGTALKPKFAYFDQVSPTLSPTLLTICSEVSDSNIMDAPNLVTCKVPKANVNPPPQFSFYSNKTMLGEPRAALETDTDYFQVLQAPGAEKGGIVDVSCHVTNTKFDDLKQEISKSITLRKPPPQPPIIEISGQTFQGTSSINIATLSQNFTGSLTCRVEGGFPEPRIASLSCGDNIGYSEANTGTVRFQNTEVTRAMDQVDCSCLAEHLSGCYDNSETTVKLKVKFLRSEEQKQENGSKITSIILPVVLIVIIAALLIVIVILILRQRKQEGTRAERMQLNDDVKA